MNVTGHKKSRLKVEDLTEQVARTSIQSQIHDQTEEMSQVEHSSIKRMSPSCQVQVQENIDNLEPPSLTFWGVSEDVEKLIPKESYVLVFNRHEYETDEGGMEVSRGNSSSEADHPPVGTPVANEASLQILASWIRKSCRILVLSGAGVSVSAGIPDFRSKGTGLYDNLQQYKLPFPEAIFDLDFFRHNPEAFVSLAKEIWMGNKYAPTITHSFVALLAKKGQLLRNYTQNIDGLEYLANLPTDKLVECHGNFRSASCIECRSPADINDVFYQIVHCGQVAVCTKCGGRVKPDIVFFGEELPDRFHALLKNDKHYADLMIVLGSSLKVAPVSLIPEMVTTSCKRALINRHGTGPFQLQRQDQDHLVDSNNVRDVFIAGECDEMILRLACLLDWQGELECLHRETLDRVQQRQSTNDPVVF